MIQSSEISFKILNIYYTYVSVITASNLYNDLNSCGLFITTINSISLILIYVRICKT